jgi:hypothetical protein
MMASGEIDKRKAVRIGFGTKCRRVKTQEWQDLCFIIFNGFMIGLPITI